MGRTEERYGSPFRKKTDVELYLDQLPDLWGLIEKRRETVRRISDRVLSVPSCCPSGDVKVQTSLRPEANFEALIVEKEQLEQELAEMQAAYESLKDQAQSIIRGRLHGTERSILIWHYISMKTWKTITEWCDVSERTVYYLRDRALSKLILPEDAIWVSL